MRDFLYRLAFLCLVALAGRASGAVLYVDVNSPNPTPPYADLSTAALTIQDAVDAANNGDLILVNDGVYQTGTRATKQSLMGLGTTYYDTNRLVITKPVTVQSIHGPGAAFIDGGGQYRCAFVTNGATLSGFTLQNGLVGWVQTTVILGRSITKTNLGNGGGVAGLIPSLSQGVVTNCIITGNNALGYGGGASDVSLVNCTLQYNNAISGGGAFDCTLSNCVVNSNSGQSTGSSSGGGPGLPATTTPGAGGGIYGGLAYNCLIENNSAFDGGGVFGAVNLVNCTIENNSATVAGGLDAAASSHGLYYALANCILYDNFASGTNSNYGTGNLTFSHCCLAPLAAGTGNFTNDPVFVNYWVGDFHPQSTSPCINSGDDAAVITPTDLDGNARIAGGTVDVGCYEFTNPASVLGYLWAQQYGVPTDGSADFLDPDGDGMNNWQEFVAGTNPTNAASVLIMNSAVPQPGLNWVVVKWQGVSTRSYFLQRSSNLSGGFVTIQTNIAGLDGPNIYLDTMATNGGPSFYRVGVQ